MNLYLLALHIIFVMSWFAGLVYMVRLFVYHAEAEKKPEPDRSILQTQYILMETRLWYIIAWPGMIGSYVFGFWMAINNYSYYFFSSWFILKLAFVFALSLYHVKCHVLYRQLKKGVVPYSSFKFRMWNEVATLLLVAIVFTVVFKDTFRFVWGVIGLILLGLTLFLAVKIYRNKREEKEEKN